jgi:hypothetical protein
VLLCERGERRKLTYRTNEEKSQSPRGRGPSRVALLDAVRAPSKQFPRAGCVGCKPRNCAFDGRSRACDHEYISVGFRSAFVAVPC